MVLSFSLAALLAITPLVHSYSLSREYRGNGLTMPPLTWARNDSTVQTSSTTSTSGMTISKRGFAPGFSDRLTCAGGKSPFTDDGVEDDPTGNSQAPSAAWYMPQDAAQSQGLVWTNAEGHFGLAVDSTSTYSGNDRRPSVRIASKDPIHHGLLILDAVHLPHGAGTWPAFWLSGADGDWPNSGEIDIIEGVGDNVQNTVSYHTSAGKCTYDTGKAQTGRLNTAVGTDCNALENNDEACSNVDSSTTSFGDGANNAGGGVWALEWTSSYVKTWHWNRNNIPRDITNNSPNPSHWGTPVTFLSSSRCNIDSSFGPQSITLNIELCGTWEGNVFSGGPQACVNHVQRNPSSFKEAYFEISYLRYYQ